MHADYCFNMPVFILESDLSYNGGERVKVISRAKWYKVKRFNRNILTERLTEKQYFIKKEAIERDEFRKFYDKKIQEKYNVGPGYEFNRWFMEEVRPTIF
jgi:hypothetical protein